jgi:hypothetical protein
VTDNTIQVAAYPTAGQGLALDATGKVPASALGGLDGWLPIAFCGLTYSSADSPTFVIGTTADLSTTIPVGAKLKLTQTTDKFFVVTAINSTTITVYGGTDYTLANAGISAAWYSLARTPFGFPQAPTKWSQELRDTTTRSQAAAVANTWYNPGSLSLAVPIGAWWLEWMSEISVSVAGNSIFGTLSTANNSESDNDFSAAGNVAGASYGIVTGRHKAILLAAKTSYFLNVKTTSGGTPTLYSNIADVPAIVRAICAYL